MRPGSAPRAEGFTYFGLLLAIASAAGAIAGGSYLLANDLRRDRELDLLFSGDEIRRAIEAYHARNASGVDPYPRTLEALLRDPNQPSVVRYLRRVRSDPMRDAGTEPPPSDTGGWTLIRNPQGQVVGVHSPSEKTPLKRSGFPKHYQPFSQARTYADWKFVAAGALQAPAAPAAASGNFVPSPLAPSGPLVPAGRGIPAAPATSQPPAPPPATATPVSAPAPAPAVAAPEAAPAPVRESVLAVPPVSPAPVAGTEPASPAAPTPAAPTPASPPATVAPPPSGVAGAPPGATAPAGGPAPSAPSATAAPAASVPPTQAPASAPVPAPAQAPAVAPSLQGDGPQSFQIRSF